jgi:hypothetical protein
MKSRWRHLLPHTSCIASENEGPGQSEQEIASLRSIVRPDSENGGLSPQQYPLVPVQ